MALARLGSNRRSESYTWPGFVDALATLLMVIIFVLMVFVLIQVNLAYRVSGQDATLGEMRQQLVSLTELLNLERKASSDLAADLAQISRELEVTTTERDDILAQLANATDALAASTAENVVLSEKQEATLAALEAARLRLDERLAALTAAEQNLAEANTKLAASETSLASTESSLAAALEKLAQTQQESVEANKQADSLAAENAASRAEILQMTKATTALRQRIEELTTLLGDLEAQATRDKVAIASLGKSLNNALANKVQELQRFRSEFFGRLREVLSGRDEVQIVGDRFVFQSEVLFNQGQANIGNSGEEQLQKLALTLADIATKIPDDINWVLQVEGHTSGAA